MRPKFEVIKGGKDIIMELSSRLQEVLKNLPDNVGTLVDTDVVLEKRREIMLWENDELLAYLQGDDLFSDPEKACTTWAVMDVTKGKTVPILK